ncbi:hypothetical protein ASPWEDRAFT_32000 [Aspergillus wentii DTO 134E9]|uniref:C2H2-type domain-containing protein n=1 Tax=Aspergillus wentii DTO 134E9 TaxID=1073089 RepID=A0A1L9R8V3_ASPWE|nr:uncharacterized protein ASPWEDRAFT_32000 [Aspergillus wentii DTO 134E9]KAI9926598.1 hypothetical protein MW887_004367 [Aspergillus wentii]OJJ31352.1 hypothetical protein ASPWEDRAFT_32000 [Aspergillus wentii DTO 134E9]
MQHSKSPTPQSAGPQSWEGPDEFTIDDLEKGISPMEHNSSFDPSISDFYLFDHNAQLHASSHDGLSALQRFPYDQNFSSGSQESLQSSQYLPAGQIAWSAHNEQWLQNIDDPSSELQPGSSYESLGLHSPPPAAWENPNQNMSSEHMWPSQTSLQSTYPISPTYRGLPRRRSRYHIKRTGSSVTPTFIPNPSSALDPMQRWQESPPEDEPASLSAIMDTLKSSRSSNSPSSTRDFHGSDQFRGFRQARSTTSSQSSAHSVSSHHSVTSSRSETSRQSQDPLTAPIKRSGGRVRKGSSKKPNQSKDKSRRFCCTFCCDQFRTKYDWARHEKSLHLNLESWICAPHGASVLSPLTGRKHCAYCNMLEPKPEHLDEHNYDACLGGTRTFRRKDHLVQHLRLTHYLETMPLIDDWKTQAPQVTSRCGFCDRRLSSWEDRVEHLASHFRNGSTMEDWQGEHDFPPEIAMHVTNALPPYYIGSDSRCLVPFSVTDIHAKDHVDQISSRAALTENNSPHEETQISPSEQTAHNPLASLMEVLATHLGRFTRQKIDQGIIPTDEMLQQESRRIVYGCEDSWNQTIFDNPEWLAAFRRQHIEQPNAEIDEQALSTLNGLSIAQP